VLEGRPRLVGLFLSKLENRLLHVHETQDSCHYRCAALRYYLMMAIGPLFCRLARSEYHPSCLIQTLSTEGFKFMALKLDNGLAAHDTMTLCHVALGNGSYVDDGRFSFIYL
jgi:hypothetical protein